jgi:hypothetical protein
MLLSLPKDSMLIASTALSFYKNYVSGAIPVNLTEAVKSMLLNPTLLPSLERVIKGILNAQKEVTISLQLPPKELNKQEALSYLSLSEFAYSQVGAPQGWTRLSKDSIGGILLHNTATGFDAEIFQNQQTGEISIAFRGTENSNDWADNFRQLSEFSPQLQQGYQLALAAKALFGNKVSFTGHSLGGAIAQVAGLATGLKTYVFNGNGLNDATLYHIGWDKVQANQNAITSVVYKGEFVSDLDNQQDGDALSGGKVQGQVHYVEDPSYFYSRGLVDNAYNRHAIAPLKQALQNTA